MIMCLQVVWLYNVRGGDVSYSPVVHSFAVVTTSSAFFYVDERKLSSEVCNFGTKGGFSFSMQMKR